MPICCVLLHRTCTEPIKEIMKDILDNGKKGGDEGFQDRDLREIQELTGTIQEELARDDSDRVLPNQCHTMRKKTWKKEEAVPGNKLTIRLSRARVLIIKNCF